MLELKENARVIFCEMMVHPAVFSHPKPERLAIYGDELEGMLIEAKKHPPLKNIACLHPDATMTRLDDCFDIIINTLDFTAPVASLFYTHLAAHGILFQAAVTPLEISTLKRLILNIQTVGFKTLQIFHFPQPKQTEGWATAIMAKKERSSFRLREQKVFNKTFKTYFYNYDTHKASLALPEFMRHTL